jgi:peptidyl-prolyl cis-trans isomerase SurA
MRMKKLMLLLRAGAAASVLVLAGCATERPQADVDSLVATVRLFRFEAISVEQFRQKVEQLESRSRTTLSLEDRKKALDLLIGEILIKQAAARDKVTVTQEEVVRHLEEARKAGSLQLRLNRELTEAEFKSLIEQSGLSWEEYNDQLQKSILIQKYIMWERRADFEAIDQPSEAEILDTYESDKTPFMAPDIVRFQHIFIDTRNLASSTDKDNARRQVEDIDRQLSKGAPFGELVVQYSDDKNSRSKGGDFGYLRRDDKAREKLLGPEFFETPFEMEVGEVSGVLASNIGFHIIRITEKIPSKLLELDDLIPPQNTTTVRQQIRSQLLLRKQKEWYQQALMEKVNELKKKAEIRLFAENLSW